MNGKPINVAHNTQPAISTINFFMMLLYQILKRIQHLIAKIIATTRTVMMIVFVSMNRL